MNKKLKILLLSNTIFVFAGNLFVPLYALFVVKVGGGIELAGWLVGIQFIVSFIVGLLVVRLKDGMKRDQKLLRANYLIRCVGWLSLGLFPSLQSLIFAQVLNGVAEAVGTPAFNTLFSENLDQKKHIREWGTWEVIKNPVIACASVLGGYFVVLHGFQSLFLIMATLALFSFFIYQKFLMGLKRK